MKRTALLTLQVISDAVMAGVALWFAYLARFDAPRHPFVPSIEPPDPAHYTAAAPITAVALVAVFALMRVYRYRRGAEFIDELFSVIGAMVITGLVLLALIGAYREPGFNSYSRLTLLYWLPIATVMIALARYAMRRYQAHERSLGRGADRALVVGSGVAADLLIQRMRMFPDYGYSPVGVLADDLEVGGEFDGLAVLGPTDDLARVVRTRGVEIVFMALPDISQDRVLYLMDTCSGLGTQFRIVPSMLELMTTSVTADHLDGIPLLQFRHGLDMAVSKVFLKRVFDTGFALIAALVLAPLLLVISLLIRLTSPGPILLHQERVGLHQRTFRMHKFRTMRPDAEQDSGPVWAAVDDPRRTPVGRLLRRFSLDELPQFWNILKGEMSWVGPRPERPVFVREFIARIPPYADRHQVRPGLTGWAQVNDLRGQTPVEERLRYDLYYIENWNLQFDLKIMLMTLFRVFSHKNAY